jgi:hypothetical protein
MPHCGTRTLALALGLALAACGGGDKKNPTPDASMGQDSGTDTGSNASCTMLSQGMLDQAGYSPGVAVIYNGPGGDPGDGNQLTLQVEFWEPGSGSGSGSASPALEGTFDLSGADYQNYANCPICVVAYSVDADGQLIKAFFQKSGTVTLTEDPTTNGHMNATFTNLELQEVTFDQDGNSTPVADGQCTTYGASLMLEHDKAPNAWTCAHDAYADGTNCDCVCGVEDLDCAQRTTVTNGCTADQVCKADACVAAAANDMCSTAQTITVGGAAVIGTTIGSYNDYDAGLEGAGCTGYSQPGEDVAYKVDLTANQTITVNLTGLAADKDMSISLVGPGAAATVCTDNITTCVKGADAGLAGENETFTYTATTAGTYYIIVDAWDLSQSGTFTLQVQ